MARNRTARGAHPVNTAVPVPEHRLQRLAEIVAALHDAKSVALTTHVNADGDGAGSEAALATWLQRMGKKVTITNPTTYPDVYMHLVGDHSWIVEPGTVRTSLALQHADILVVVDTGERGRIGRVGNWLNGRSVIVIDHHLPSEDPLTGLVLQDDIACATGELVYDLMCVAGLERPWPDLICRSIYTAILTDTGSFRFSNTSVRAHAIAGDLIAQGVNPEEIYRAVYGSVPLRRVRLLEIALRGLEIDKEYPITWITLEYSAMQRTGTGGEDLDGIVDQARVVEGTEVAILFRETPDGSTKISLRSGGVINVNAIAKLFGGGGHIKASGALVSGRPDEAIPRVLDATRAAIDAQLPDFRRGRGRR
jgi:bifunctional oligoribonuclease and PAP phosphatase NrnA